MMIALVVVVITFIELVATTLECSDNPEWDVVWGDRNALCPNAINRYTRGRGKASEYNHEANLRQCSELKIEHCEKIEPSCCKSSNPDLEQDKINQRVMLDYQHINEYLRYYGPNNAHNALVDQTFIKYTIDKKLFALKIDQNKLLTLPTNYDDTKTYLFQERGARKKQPHIMYAPIPKQQTQIGVTDIQAAIENDNSPDAQRGARVNSRVTVIDGATLQSKQKPFSRIGMILHKYYDDTVSPCSGTLISKNLVLTAIHCAIDKNIILPVENIRFYPQWSKALSIENKYEYPEGTYFQAKAVYFYYGYYRLDRTSPKDKPAKANWDVALIEIDGNLRKDYGYLAFAAPPTATIRSWIDNHEDDIINIGYPTDRPRVRGIMYKGKVFGGGRVRKAVYALGHHGPEVDIYTQSYHQLEQQIVQHGELDFLKYDDSQTVEATQIEDDKIIDNKYETGPGQSGSCAFHWDSDTNQYVAFAIVSAGRTRITTTSKYRTYFKRITYELALQINDIIKITDIETSINSNGLMELLPANPNNDARINYINKYMYHNDGVNYIDDDDNDERQYLTENVVLFPISDDNNILITMYEIVNSLLVLLIFIALYLFVSCGVILILDNYNQDKHDYTRNDFV